jgi:hypothetical protein
MGDLDGRWRKGELDGVSLSRFEGVEVMFAPLAVVWLLRMKRCPSQNSARGHPGFVVGRKRGHDPLEYVLRVSLRCKLEKQLKESGGERRRCTKK